MFITGCARLLSVRTQAALAVLFAGLCLSFAAPFSKQFQVTQPGGAAVHLWGAGDEFSAVFETLDGYAVTFDPSQRAYCYGQLSADASELLSTGVQVQDATGSSLGLARHLRISGAALRQQIAARFARWDSAVQVSSRWRELKTSAASGPQKSQFAPPKGGTVGLKVGLTLLIDFDDDPATITQGQVVDFCNGNNYTEFGNNGSVKAFYSYNSNGKLIYTNAVTLYVRAPHPKSYYNDTTQDAGQQARMLITDCLTVMKGLTNYTTDFLPLFNSLTTDSRNTVVAFNVFYAGGNGNVWSMGLWPHSWALANPVELSPGGKKVSSYQISNIGDQLEIGTFCHENGHMLCGYPDLYDYTYASAGVGNWWLMAGCSWGGTFSNPGDNPAQICAYLKRASGWGATIECAADSSYVATVSSAAGPNFNVFYRFQKPGVLTEYYLAESRYETNHDASLPGSGVAVWHIDELGDNSTVNLNPNLVHRNFEATLVQADNRWDLEKNNNSGDANDLYYRSNSVSLYSNRLSDTTAPNAHWWDGTASGLVFREFSAISNTMTFIIGTNNPAPTITVQPADQVVLQGMPAGFAVGVAGIPPLSFQWSKDGSPVPGATLSRFNLASARTNDAGAYTVAVTNNYGAAKSSAAHLTVIPTVPLPFALNNSNILWTTDAQAPWYGQTSVSHDGTGAARGYFIGNSQSTTLRAQVSGPGTLAFWWRTSSQAGADMAHFSDIGGGLTNAFSASGERDWTLQTVYLPSGS